MNQIKLYTKYLLLLKLCLLQQFCHKINAAAKTDNTSIITLTSQN